MPVFFRDVLFEQLHWDATEGIRIIFSCSEKTSPVIVLTAADYGQIPAVLQSFVMYRQGGTQATSQENLTKLRLGFTFANRFQAFLALNKSIAIQKLSSISVINREEDTFRPREGDWRDPSKNLHLLPEIVRFSMYRRGIDELDPGEQRDFHEENFTKYSPNNWNGLLQSMTLPLFADLETILMRGKHWRVDLEDGTNSDGTENNDDLQDDILRDDDLNLPTNI